MATEACKSPGETIAPHPATAVRPQGQQTAQPAKAARSDGGTVLRLTTDELVRLAPRLRPYLTSPAPTWPEIIDAADWLRADLGVSRPLWGEACLAMGREEAAIAIAIVSAKPAAHFTSSAGGYFHGMVEKAKAGTLNLARTVWGLRASANHPASKPTAMFTPTGAEGRWQKPPH